MPQRERCGGSSLFREKICYPCAKARAVYRAIARYAPRMRNGHCSVQIGCLQWQCPLKVPDAKKITALNKNAACMRSERS